MALSREEVDHIASLACLDLTNEEKERYRQQLSEILAYMDSLTAVDTEEIPPTSSVLPPQSVLRPDEAAQPLSTRELLSNAPQVEKNQFRVPPVLDQSP
jgi:aspartyl-tRNA(Asn)/glutamyl-tRNA(Gln) amidotransferase subunit C